jgi:hypothetical protein
MEDDGKLLKEKTNIHPNWFGSKDRRNIYKEKVT